MARKFVKPVLIVLAISISFIAGALTASKRGWGSPLVTVAVHNNTSAPLRAVNLRYGSCASEGTAFRSGKPLAVGESRKFQFLVCGEGEYTVEAVLENGSQLSSSTYVESGYTSNEYIEPNRIRSESSFNRW